MTRLPVWTIIGVLAAMLIGTVHAYAELLLERKRAYQLFPRGWGQW
jgi:hypothetical protein